MLVSKSVSPNTVYSSRKKNTPRRKEKRMIRKNNDASFASDVDRSKVYHDINWPATPSSGAHTNVNASVFVSRGGKAASITSTVVRGEKKKEANVRIESKEDSKVEKSRSPCWPASSRAR